MALDWADERASAGRSFHTGLWLCLGPYEGQRVEDLIVGHWSDAAPSERQAMGFALARAHRLTAWTRNLRKSRTPKYASSWSVPAMVTMAKSCLARCFPRDNNSVNTPSQ